MYRSSICDVDLSSLGTVVYAENRMRHRKADDDNKLCEQDLEAL
jgi:hypothetical protein